MGNRPDRDHQLRQIAGRPPSLNVPRSATVSPAYITCLTEKSDRSVGKSPGAGSVLDTPTRPVEAPAAGLTPFSHNGSQLFKNYQPR